MSLKSEINEEMQQNSDSVSLVSLEDHGLSQISLGKQNTVKEAVEEQLKDFFW